MAGKKSSERRIEIFTGSTGEEELKMGKALQDARAAGIDLYQFFRTGVYRSPEELQVKLDEIARKRGIKLDTANIASYLMGALDHDDYDSPLRTVQGHTMESTENVFRQALSTLIRTVGKFGPRKN